MGCCCAKMQWTFHRERGVEKLHIRKKTTAKNIGERGGKKLSVHRKEVFVHPLIYGLKFQAFRCFSKKYIRI